MATDDSRRDLRSTLGALTPPAPVVARPIRGTQNSGLFDLSTLYPAELDRAIQRARGSRQVPLEVDREDTVVALAPSLPTKPGARRIIGRVRASAPWIATTALGLVVAASLPAHAHRLTPVAAIAAAAPPAAPPLPPPSSMPAASPVLPLQDLPPTTAASDKLAQKPATGKAPSPAPRSRSAVPQGMKTADASTRASAKAAAAGPTSLDDLIRQTVQSESKAGRRK